MSYCSLKQNNNFVVRQAFTRFYHGFFWSDSVLELLEDYNEVIDITTGWHEVKDHIKMYNSNNVNLLSIARGPRYIHPESDLHSRPTINSKADLKEMYPDCFGGFGMFKDFEYDIKLIQR